METHVPYFFPNTHQKSGKKTGSSRVVLSAGHNKQQKVGRPQKKLGGCERGPFALLCLDMESE